MPISDDIKNALTQNTPNEPLLAFGTFRITNWLGSGEQGVVIKVQGPLGKEFALKLYSTKSTERSTDEGVRAFQREIEALIRLSHNNIVRVYTGGTAKFTARWEIQEGFPTPPSPTDIQYYLMDYIDRRLDDIFPELKDDDLLSIPPPIPGTADTHLRNKAKLFEQMIIQLTTAMAYYHQQGLTHKDIKPENIRYNTHDSAFVLVDFGFARHLGSAQDKDDVHKVRCLDWPAVMAKDYVRADIGALAIILRHILPSLAPIYHGWRYAGLSECLERALSQDVSERSLCAIDFSNNIRRFFVMYPAWNLTLALGDCLTPSQFSRFSSTLRLPVSGSILISKEVAAIIDSPDFQRLRGTRQLGPTIFVFPGANHTRFEHSIGTYGLALQYLARVLRNPHGRHLDEHLEHSIKLIVLSALLHDIGHYPYSHWVEEIEEFPGNVCFPTHEQRARGILTKGPLSDTIKNMWEMNPDEVANVIAGVRLPGASERLANSFIDSAVDVDKVDYLVRDSVHCGVDYGQGIDVERLFDSLYIDVKNERLCLTNKGLPSLLSLLTCRNILYQAVYWHKTVRACEAMFKRFFYEFIGLKKWSEKEMAPYFALSDDAFTKALNEQCDTDDSLKQLMRPFVFGGRTIYKPAYIFNEGQAGDEPNAMRYFFNKVLTSHSYKQIVDMSNQLSVELKKYIPDIQPLELLLESTPTKKQHTWFDLQALRVKDSRRDEYHSLPSEIMNVNDYLDRNRQAYLFCHPRHYDRLVELARTGQLRSILEAY